MHLTPIESGFSGSGDRQAVSVDFIAYIFYHTPKLFASDYSLFFIYNYIFNKYFYLPAKFMKILVIYIDKNEKKM